MADGRRLKNENSLNLRHSFVQHLHKISHSDTFRHGTPRAKFHPSMQRWGYRTPKTENFITILL